MRGSLCLHGQHLPLADGGRRLSSADRRPRARARHRDRFCRHPRLPRRRAARSARDCRRVAARYRHRPLAGARRGGGGHRSRYTHRTAISNERIRSISQSEVAFTVRADDKGGKRVEKLDGDEFVRRFMQHVLPSGVKRIRHYGVLASSCKAKKLNAARVALQVPAVSPEAIESAQGFMARVAKLDVTLCPCCKVGHLHVTVALKGLRAFARTGVQIARSKPGATVMLRLLRACGFNWRPVASRAVLRVVLIQTCEGPPKLITDAVVDADLCAQYIAPWLGAPQSPHFN